MRVLITGGTGLLGKSLIEVMPSDCQILATYVGDYIMEDTDKVKYLKLDIRNNVGYENMFVEFKPDVVIHTASIGSPDYAENNREMTWEINVIGANNILSLCEKYNTVFIHISSNGIYDGRTAPYKEDDIAIPLNYYGETKLQAEKITQKAQIPFAIVRPILMYGWNHIFERPNIVTIALAKLAKGEKVFVYDDVYSNPLFSRSCAEAVWQIVKTKHYEVFNIAGKERVSIYELVKRAAEVFNLNQNLVIPVQQGYFNELVSRPKDTSYCTDKMEKILTIKPLTLAEGLKKMKEAQK